MIGKLDNPMIAPRSPADVPPLRPASSGRQAGRHARPITACAWQHVLQPCATAGPALGPSAIRRFSSTPFWLRG
jgi:hypothetical protein